MIEKLKKAMERLQEIRDMTELTQEIRTERDGLLEAAKLLKSDIQKDEEARTLDTFMAETPKTPVNEMPEIQTDQRSGIELTPTLPFKNFGQQLVGIAAITRANERGVHGNAHIVETRNKLEAITRAGATGVSANVDSEAGFMIQTNFAGMMWDSAVKDSGILSRVDTYTCSADSNAVEWMRPKETDISNNVVYDGIRMYRAAEAQTVAASKATLEKYRLELEKSMGFVYWSGEAVKHANFLGQFYQNGFRLAIMRQCESEIISGSGVGQCQGILNAGNAVQQKAIEPGQTLTTPYVYPNITGMFNILHTEDRANAVWLAHPDCEEKLMHVVFPVGTGGVPVFLGPGGGIGPGVSTLHQRPIIPTDHCSAVGSVGDLMLVNLNKYMLLRKGTEEMNTSIHVLFLTDEEVFRIIVYVNGVVKNPNALTIKNSAIKRASFVTLGARV